MNRVGWCAIVRNLEFGNLLLAGVPRGVGGEMRGATLCMDMLRASFLHVKRMKLLDDRIGVNLYGIFGQISSCSKFGEGEQRTNVACERHVCRGN